MASEHTGLLAVVVTDPDDCQAAKDQYISTVDGDHFAYAARCPEDARRFVAAWNACAGIPTETLEEAKHIPGIVGAYEQGRAVEKARADALAARLAEIHSIIRMCQADGRITAEDFATLTNLTGEAKP